MLLEVSTAAINANAQAIILATIFIGTMIVLAILSKDQYKKYNSKHDVLHVSGDLVTPMSLKNDKYGLSSDGVPFYSGAIDEEAIDAAIAEHKTYEEDQQLAQSVEVKKEGSKNAA